MDNNNNGSRYKAVKNYEGIREDIISGNYLVNKRIAGKRYSKSFLMLADAIKWRREFHPNISSSFNTSQPDIDNNGVKKFLFMEAWEKYKQFKFPILEKSTIDTTLSRERNYIDLMKVRMVDLNPDFFRDYIVKKKKEAVLTNTRRYSFDHELKELKIFFNWYSEQIDYKFINPIKKSHFQLGVIKKLVPKDKKIPIEDCLKFWEALPIFFADFAMVQHSVAGRVQEIAGLQTYNLDLQNRVLTIKEVIVWNRKKKFDYLKPYPKNKESRYCFITDSLMEIIKRRLALVPKGCTYLFHDNGNPLEYRQIQYAYDKALKDCGLGDKYSGTHIMRHSMATTTRRVTGSVDATQAITGHKDVKLVQHYGALPTDLQKETAIRVEKFLNELKAVKAGV